MGSRKNKVIVDREESTRVMKVPEKMFKVEIQPDINIFKSIHSIIHTPVQTISTVTSETNSKLSVDNPKSFKIVLPKIKSPHCKTFVMEKASLWNVPDTILMTKTVTSPIIKHKKDSVSSITDKNFSVHDETAQEESLFEISKEKLEDPLDLYYEADGNDSSIRRSKRKRIPKIKNDEPYKRPKDEVLNEKEATKERKIKKKRQAVNVVTGINVDFISNNENELNSQSIDTEMPDTLDANVDLTVKDLIADCMTPKITSSASSLSEPLCSVQVDTEKETQETKTKENFDEISNEEISLSNSHFKKLDPIISCYECDSLFKTRYAIIFTQRFYCCRECLPTETTREYRQGSVIKQYYVNVGSCDSKMRISPKKYVLLNSQHDVPFTTSDCSDLECMSEKKLEHKGESSFSKAVRILNKRNDNNLGKLSVAAAEKLTEEKKTPVTSPISNCSSPNEFKYEIPSIKIIKTKDLSKKDRWKCPLKHCDGKGHTNGKYPSHRSLFGCPLARSLTKRSSGTNKCPNPDCDSSGSTIFDQTTHKSLTTCPLLTIDHERSCPVPGCDGKGNRKKTGRYTTHRSVATCPRASQLNINVEDVTTFVLKPARKSKSTRHVISPPTAEIRNLEDNSSPSELISKHNVMHKEVTLLALSNTEIKNDIPKAKQQLRSLEKEVLHADERLEELLVEEYQAKNKLREQRTTIEDAIKLACIPVNFSDITNDDHERFFERLKNYFNDRHTSIYREKLKSYLTTITRKTSKTYFKL